MLPKPPKKKKSCLKSQKLIASPNLNLMGPSCNLPGLRILFWWWILCDTSIRWFCWILLDFVGRFLHPSIMNDRCVFISKKSGWWFINHKCKTKTSDVFFSFNLGGDFVVMNFMAKKKRLEKKQRSWTVLVVEKGVPSMQRMCRRPKPYDRIVGISNGFWPNPDLVGTAPIIGAMPAAQTTRCRLWRQNSWQALVSHFNCRVQENKHLKETTATCKSVFWGELLLVSIIFLRIQFSPLMSERAREKCFVPKSKSWIPPGPTQWLLATCPCLPEQRPHSSSRRECLGAQVPESSLWLPEPSCATHRLLPIRTCLPEQWPNCSSRWECLGAHFPESPLWLSEPSWAT